MADDEKKDDKPAGGVQVEDKRSATAEELPDEAVPDKPQDGSQAAGDDQGEGEPLPFEEQVVLGLQSIADILEGVYWCLGGPEIAERNKRHYIQDQQVMAQMRAEAQARAEASGRRPAGQTRGIPGIRGR